MVLGGFGSAGSSRSLRRTASAVGVGSTTAERERRAAKAPPATLDEPDRDAILRAVETQQCCWCDDPRTFRSLAGHLVRTHGIDLHELRERLVLPVRFPFSSEGFRAACAQRAIAEDRASKLATAKRPTTHRSSAYARAQARARVARMTADQRRAGTESARRALAAAPPEVRSERGRRAALAVGHATRVRTARAGGAGRARQMAEPGVRAALTATREANASEEYRAARRARLIAADKARPQYRRPHACPGCGATVPTSHPIYCPECIPAARRAAARKAAAASHRSLQQGVSA